MYQTICLADMFTQDGTLTDSIAAVEAAWGKVAADIGQDPAYVIAATHGKRAIDNLAQFKPHLQAHEIDAEVDAFEKTILYYADAYGTHGLGSQSQTSSESTLSASSSGCITPALSIGSSVPSNRSSLVDVFSSVGHRPSFRTCLSDMLTQTILSAPGIEVVDDVIMEEVQPDKCLTEAYAPKQQLKQDVVAAWQVEAASIDRSVRILPGVKKMLSCIPKGRYAVATSGAKTYGSCFIFIS
jgi:hypothetical protein